jgi:hypothetical protein
LSSIHYSKRTQMKNTVYNINSFFTILKGHHVFWVNEFCSESQNDENAFLSLLGWLMISPGWTSKNSRMRNDFCFCFWYKSCLRRSNYTSSFINRLSMWSFPYPACAHNMVYMKNLTCPSSIKQDCRVYGIGHMNSLFIKLDV